MTVDVDVGVGAVKEKLVATGVAVVESRMSLLADLLAGVDLSSNDISRAISTGWPGAGGGRSLRITRAFFTPIWLRGAAFLEVIKATCRVFKLC